jgi:hypothetical protein
MKCRPNLKSIISAANIHFGFDVTLKRRFRDIVRARQVTSYVAHRIFKYSQSETGLALGLDHATVLYGCNVIGAEIDLYPDVKKNVKDLYNRCKIKDQRKTPNELIYDVLENWDVDINMKIRLREILKSIK